ncbi:holo-[acyl-carrier-protein] synthase [Wolbachia endosymbiont of Diaphorina citri]|jgi:holo-[acyl-carrier-protein] synthase|uniref:holo-[acyl-carrier-protein] synthase n=1 Tax=Wolbachia endosymbiont of Diaphorina citri TaxID=116598 RepID=UPI00030C0D94|nr:holo-[acyl-carrier-protein] synthase [Wolbachia endosymbiont of Diaphorina citri]QJT94950.1 holo-[acyl-carrier-protein] synthase [Wolbachia endosymbiont of Diaphorina citri]QJT96051.1 holo-[acyl-carrier-protein] synthase [Wolbachia endosymbiont of Diaphorina citri]QJT97413.1 holo-[acyl-carrier-protein] synthase [Wolbachia endosymbiont of Diaphorina citri]QLK11897.1 holo-[acyl-carrier-protein] synthase [Wolbachia endosymbiont of Diaphorina citri]QXY86758.1 holo-[acyl-carrier-protein] synthas
MIYGIGTDIVYIPRILRISQKYGEKFLNKVYTKKEIEISKKYNSQEVRAKYFAKRFAAKEAFVKALGTGFSQGIIMKDIEIYSNIRGKPHLAITKDFISKDYKIHLSLSDDQDYVTAFVVICV